MNSVSRTKNNLLPRKLGSPGRVTREIIKMMSKKDSLFSKFMKSRKPGVLVLFKKQRNAVTSAFRKAKRKCFYAAFENERRIDIIWKKLN